MPETGLAEEGLKGESLLVPQGQLAGHQPGFMPQLAASALVRHDWQAQQEGGAAAEPLLTDEQAAVLARYEACIITHQYSHRTLRNYRNAFKSYLRSIAPRLPEQLAKEDVAKWVRDRVAAHGGSSSLHNTMINAIKFYYVNLERRPSGGYVFDRPKARIQQPVTLTKDEVQRMMAQTQNLKHRCLLLVGYSTGLRLKEVLALRRSDIHFDQRLVSIQPTESGHGMGRVVPLSPKVVDALKAYFAEFEPKTWLFEGEVLGTPYSERSAQMVVKQAAVRAGLNFPVSMHVLRNSYATHQLEAGIAVSAVQDLMGHSSIRTTGRYAHVARHKLPASPADGLEL